MSFMDNLKRSLGFENINSDKHEGINIVDKVQSFLNSSRDHKGEYDAQQQYNVNSQQMSNPQQSYGSDLGSANQQTMYDDLDDYVITPEQSFYEIILIRPKSIDDINYVVDQILEEKNPVILDLSFLEKESAPNFKLAGDKIKQLRNRHGVQAVLLEHSADKNLIILAPKKVKVINKG